MRCSETDSSGVVLSPPVSGVGGGGGGRVWVGEGKVVVVVGGGGYSFLPVIIFKRLYPQSVSIMVGLVWT